MNDKLDGWAKGLAQSLTRKLLCLAVATQFAWPAQANHFKRDPLVRISDPYPLAGCDDVLRPPGRNSIDAQPEPYVAVNPANPRNIVAVWIAGFAQRIIVAGFFDGGRRWRW